MWRCRERASSESRPCRAAFSAFQCLLGCFQPAPKLSCLLSWNCKVTGFWFLVVHSSTKGSSSLSRTTVTPAPQRSCHPTDCPGDAFLCRFRRLQQQSHHNWHHASRPSSHPHPSPPLSSRRALSSSSTLGLTSLFSLFLSTPLLSFLLILLSQMPSL
jgi:hypothetical protein